MCHGGRVGLSVGGHAAVAAAPGEQVNVGKNAGLRIETGGLAMLNESAISPPNVSVRLISAHSRRRHVEERGKREAVEMSVSRRRSVLCCYWRA